MSETPFQKAAVYDHVRHPNPHPQYCLEVDCTATKERVTALEVAVADLEENGTGTPGPAGPAGPTGPQGPAGPATPCGACLDCLVVDVDDPSDPELVFDVPALTFVFDFDLCPELAA